MYKFSHVLALHLKSIVNFCSQQNMYFWFVFVYLCIYMEIIIIIGYAAYNVYDVIYIHTQMYLALKLSPCLKSFYVCENSLIIPTVITNNGLTSSLHNWLFFVSCKARPETINSSIKIIINFMVHTCMCIWIIRILSDMCCDIIGYFCIFS